MNTTDACRAMTEYKYYEARLNTFETWPKQMTPDKYTLAKCGFVYSGKGDKVTCFHCGIHLKDWERNDDPWKEHYKWRTQCDYLNMVGWNGGLDVPDTRTATQGFTFGTAAPKPGFGQSTTEPIKSPFTDSHYFVNRY